MKRLLLLSLLALASINSKAQSILLNTGFENWSMTTFLEPDSWATHAYGAEQNPDAHTGNYAVTIHNWYYYGEGYLGNGYTDNNYSHYGSPYTGKPLYLTGFYKYDTLGSGNIADSAYGVVMLRKWNTVTGLRDTVAIGDIKLGLSNVYKQFQINVIDLAPGVMPDSIEVVFVSCVESSCMCSNDSNGVCLYLTVDDIMLTTPNGVESIESVLSKTRVAPNPFKGVTTVYLKNEEKASACLYDVTGRKVKYWDSVAGTFAVEGEQLQPGIYFLHIIGDDNRSEKLKLVME